MRQAFANAWEFVMSHIDFYNIRRYNTNIGQTASEKNIMWNNTQYTKIDTEVFPNILKIGYIEKVPCCMDYLLS